MRRYVIGSLLLGLLNVPLLAQQQQEYPLPPMPKPPKAGEPRPTTIQEKLRYICKQLDLDERQKQHAEGLFAVLEAEATSSADELRAQVDLIQSTYQQMMAARDAGKTEEAEALRQKLMELSPVVMAEKNFAEGLMPVLNEEQRQKFELLRKQLENVTDLSLKPIQVVRLAREFNLGPDQQQKLADLQKALRKEMMIGPDDEPRRNQLLEKFISDVGALLDPTQRAEFELRIAKLRPDTPPAAAKPKPVPARSGRAPVSSTTQPKNP